jgi:hypothetical protein
MPIRVNNIPKFRAAAHDEMRKRLSRAAIEVSRHAHVLVSVAGPAPSPPGQPPHKQTGHLRRSITWELVSDTVARVGTNIKYGRWLELGTKRMSPRPWLVRSLAETKAAVIRQLTAPWKGP